jgi:hypothetical protein
MGNNITKMNFNFKKIDKRVLILIILIVGILLLLYFYVFKSSFNNVINGNINDSSPRMFPELVPPPKENIVIAPNDTSVSLLGNSSQEQRILPPKADIPEEAGFPIYGKGVSTDTMDSNIFVSENVPGKLHVEYPQNESFGESMYSDQFGSRIIKLKNAGTQSQFKGLDESQNKYVSGAYGMGGVQSGYTLMGNGVNYSSDFIPKNGLKMEASPGSYSLSNECESTYPNTVLSNGACLTAGDIPYDSVVNGKVNPRLVSRWESYTGNYNAEEVLKGNSTLFPVV